MLNAPTQQDWLFCVMIVMVSDLVWGWQGFKGRGERRGGGHRIKHGRAFAGVLALWSFHRLHSPTCMDVYCVLPKSSSNKIGPSNKA